MKRIGTKIWTGQRYNCRIDIPIKEVEVIDSTKKGSKSIQMMRRHKKDTKVENVTMLMIEDSIALETKHYSPQLQPSYFNSNKKYKIVQAGKSISKDSLHRPSHIRNYSITSQSGSYARLNWSLCQYNVIPIQHTSIRFYSPHEARFNQRKEKSLGCYKELVLSTKEVKSCGQLKPYTLHQRADKVIGTKQDDCVQRIKKSSESLTENDKKHDENTSVENTAVENINRSKEADEFLSYGSAFCLTIDYPQSLELSVNFPKNSSLIYSSTNFDVTPFEKSGLRRIRRRFEMNRQHLHICSRDALRNKIGQRRFHSDTQVFKRAQLNEANRIGHRKKLQGNGTRDKVETFGWMPDDVGLSAAANKLLIDLHLKKKGNELSTEFGDLPITEEKLNMEALDDRMTRYKRIKERCVLTQMKEENNYSMIANYFKERSKPFTIESRLWHAYIKSNNLKKAHHNLCKKYSENLYKQSYHKQDMKTSLDNDEFFMATKPMYSLFKDFANNVMRLLRDVTSWGQNEKYKFPNNKMWYKSELPVKPQQYDPTIKSRPGVAEVDRRSAHAQSKQKKILIHASKARNDHAVGCREAQHVFMGQFKRRSSNVKLYNPILDVNYLGKENPQILSRFCHILGDLMKEIDGVVKKEDGKVGCSFKSRSNANKNIVEKEQQKMMKSKLDSTVALQMTKGYHLFSAVSLANNEASKRDACLQVKIKPLNSYSKFSEVHITDMKVNVVDKPLVETERRSQSHSIKSDKTEADDTAVKRSTDKAGKCILLDLKLSIPFTTVDVENPVKK